MTRRSAALVVLGGLSVAAAQQPPSSAPTNAFTSAADLELGRQLYAGRCGHCHGLDGEGGRGSVLNAGRLRRGDSDRELFQVIRNGIPNTEMPGSALLPEAEVWRMVAHVQRLSRRGAADSPVAGDARAGAIVYQRNGCAACHSIDGQGGYLGQDLSDVGAKRAPRHLRESIVKPDADLPLDYRSVTVTTAAGQRVSGIHLNEDEYSIQLRDMSGNLRSFLKAGLEDLALPRTSLMPPFAALPETDLENLVAYLASRRPGSGGGGSEPESVEWAFDRLDRVGGHATTLLGQPKLIDSPRGKAVAFDGVGDALIVDNHPLAGARTFTIEALFRPDGGPFEQRWLHLSERDPATGQDADNRMLLEIRVVGDQWFLDSYHQSGTASKALMNRAALHPLGAWYHVATVYDGEELRNYVNGVQEGASPLKLAPSGPGRASIGVRLNKVYFFKGAVERARFTRRALTPAEFLKP